MRGPSKRKLAEQRANGNEARRILEAGPVKDALDKMEADAVASWKSTLIDDTEKREDAYRMFQTIGLFKANLNIMVANGTKAADDLLRSKGES